MGGGGKEEDAFHKLDDYKAKLRGVFKSEIGHRLLSKCLMQPLMAPKNS